MDKYIGRLLDNRYEILEVIGTGGMAVVYKARCHRLNRLVAIKILKDDFLEDEDFRRRFHTESQAVAMLSHPNIVSVYDVSSSVTADYIVMELIEGITLKRYMETRKHLNWKETLHFAIQIAKALEHAHSRGVVHRDIKPHNIMVLKNGSVKVTDFGIARMKSQSNTLTKEALGSVHYISPEQAKGGRVDDRSDLYSLGVVMYEMMAGRPPYDGESPVAVAIKHINGGAPMPSTLNPNIPGGLEQIIMKAMAHDPADRFASATRMLADLDEFRKAPAMLFDYNVPPVDAVTKLIPEPQVTPPPVVEHKPPRKTTAERQAERLDPKRNPPKRKPAKESRDSSRAATIAVVVCAVAVLLGIVIMLITFMSGGLGGETLYEVPQFVGEVYENLPEYSQFEFKGDWVYDETAEEGVIIHQQPEAGRQIKKGNTIYLTISKGKAPEDAKILLNLVGMKKNDAINHLNSLSLNLDIRFKEENHESYAVDTVIRTEPGEGASLTTGQTLYLVVSIGPEMRDGTMPDVTGQTQEQAVRTLESQNLKLNVSADEVFDSNVAAGRVVRTEPSVGSKLETGQAVKLYISKGPETKPMPSVVGDSEDEAREAIRAYGFNGVITLERVHDDKPEGTVLQQYPEKLLEVDVNTEIKLTVSLGPKPTEPPVKTLDVVFRLDEPYVPAEGDTYQLEIWQGGQKVNEVTMNKDDLVTDPVSVTGSGKLTYELRIGGEIYGTQEVDFTIDG